MPCVHYALKDKLSTLSTELSFTLSYRTRTIYEDLGVGNARERHAFPSGRRCSLRALCALSSAVMCDDRPSNGLQRICLITTGSSSIKFHVKAHYHLFLSAQFVPPHKEQSSQAPSPYPRSLVLDEPLTNPKACTAGLSYFLGFHVEQPVYSIKDPS